MITAQVHVMLKKTVADPQGLAVRHALESLGYAETRQTRVGKYITVELDTDDEAEARSRVEGMCRKILANPIIEDFSFTLEKQ